MSSWRTAGAACTLSQEQPLKTGGAADVGSAAQPRRYPHHTSIPTACYRALCRNAPHPWRSPGPYPPSAPPLGSLPRAAAGIAPAREPSRVHATRSLTGPPQAPRHRPNACRALASGLSTGMRRPGQARRHRRRCPQMLMPHPSQSCNEHSTSSFAGILRPQAANAQRPAKPSGRGSPADPGPASPQQHGRRHERPTCSALRQGVQPARPQCDRQRAMPAVDTPSGQRTDHGPGPDAPPLAHIGVVTTCAPLGPSIRYRYRARA